MSARTSDPSTVAAEPSTVKPSVRYIGGGIRGLSRVYLLLNRPGAVFVASNGNANYGHPYQLAINARLTSRN